MQIVEGQHQRRMLRVELEESPEDRLGDGVLVLLIIAAEGDRLQKGVVAVEPEVEEAADEVHHLGHAPIAEHLGELDAHALLALGVVFAVDNPEAIFEHAPEERMGRGVALPAAPIDPRPARGAGRMALSEARQPLAEDPTLADALRSDDGDELRRAIIDRALKDGVELLELG